MRCERCRRRSAVVLDLAPTPSVGRVTARDLHFELRRAGLVSNPLYLPPLPRRGSHVEEMDADEPEDG